MAIGWLTVLTSVPWSDVIRNAPKVADGAKKLWNAVGKKPAPAISEADATPLDSHEPRSLAALEARTAALETAVSDLNEQMMASSELIKALAEQNAQLVKGMEANRVRQLWLAAATAALALVVLFGLVWAPQ